VSSKLIWHFFHGFMITLFFCHGALAAQVNPGLKKGVDYVGNQTCIGCHAKQGAAWAKSHHAQSMQEVSEKSVLGKFDNVELIFHGQATRFFKKDATYYVNTLNAKGKNQDFKIAYTFGVYPLQQYLIALPGGRLQVLAVAWDVRPQASGGQRWFHLYPDSPPVPSESIFWTARDQNWNFMCATCHSTGVLKNYNVSKDQFDTTWASINVACEACHGAGSAHVQWAQGDRHDKPDGLKLIVNTQSIRAGSFGFSKPGQKIASLQNELPVQRQAAGDICLPCHTRRQELVVDNNKDQAAKFLDHYQPSLIEKDLYYADGQIDGEVFEGGSFAQSAMHQAGVTCLNCHEPHGATLRAEGNALCTQCHRSDFYDKPEHHHHPINSDGAKCVNCHMPTKTYMGVHERRDHSLRIPRPDLTVAINTPNACNQCHKEKSAAWAVLALKQWPNSMDSPAEKERTDSAHALHQAWYASPAVDVITKALPSARSGIESASLINSFLPGNHPKQNHVLAVAAHNSDGLVRLGLARSLMTTLSQTTLPIAISLLSDPLLAVRIEAARALIGVDPALLNKNQLQELQLVTAELIKAEQASADRPESHTNLGAIYVNLGEQDSAEKEFRIALHLDPDFAPALVNLADFYRVLHKDDAGEPLLRRAVKIAPKEAEPAYALGLLLIRKGMPQEALVWLKKAVELSPTNARYSNVLNMAMKEIGTP